jgi:hypothetical protein
VESVTSQRIVYVNDVRHTEGGRVDDTSIDLGTQLADLTDVLLDDLRTTDAATADTPLAHSIRRILAESTDGHPSVVAGHDVSI